MTLFSYGSDVDPLLLTNLLSAFDTFGDSLFGRPTKIISYGDKNIIIARKDKYAVALVANESSKNLEILAQIILGRFLSKYITKLNSWDGFENTFMDFNDELEIILQQATIDFSKNKVDGSIYSENIIQKLGDNFASILWAYLVGVPIIVIGDNKEQLREFIHGISDLFNNKIDVIYCKEPEHVNELVSGQKARVIIGTSTNIEPMDTAIFVEINGKINRHVNIEYLMETTKYLKRFDNFSEIKEFIEYRIKFLSHIRAFLENEHLLGSTNIEKAARITSLSEETIKLINQMISE